MRPARCLRSLLWVIAVGATLVCALIVAVRLAHAALVAAGVF